MFKYKPAPKDFVEYAPGDLMSRMVTAGDGRFRMGFAKYSSGITWERATWFDEVFYIIKGKMEFTYRSYIPPRKGLEKSLEVNAGEAVFMSRGTWMKYKAADGTEIFYVAMPASSKGVDYIIRQEIHPEEAHVRTY